MEGGCAFSATFHLDEEKENSSVAPSTEEANRVKIKSGGEARVEAVFAEEKKNKAADNEAFHILIQSRWCIFYQIICACSGALMMCVC